MDPDLGDGSMGTVSVRVVDAVFRNGKRTDNQVLSVRLFSRTTEQTSDSPAFRLDAISVHVRQGLSFIGKQEVNNSSGVVPVSNVIDSCQVECRLVVKEGNDTGSLIIGGGAPDVVFGSRSGRGRSTGVNLVGDNIPAMRTTIVTRFLDGGDLGCGESKGSPQKRQKGDSPHSTKEIGERGWRKNGRGQCQKRPNSFEGWEAQKVTDTDDI